MQFLSNWRAVLAATTLFLLLAGSYEIAVRWPTGRLMPDSSPASLLAGSASQAAVMPGQPGPSATAEPPGPLPTAAQLGYHRYVGTIGGRPVLAEITLSLAADADPTTKLRTKLTGNFYYRTTGLSGLWGEQAWVLPNQCLETAYVDYAVPRVGCPVPIPLLCAEQPPGLPLITGWYTAPRQQRALPVRLRESYADGVRYELLQEVSWGRSYMAEEGPTDSTEVEQAYLHLLGPDTLRPALARLQCPPPAARRLARLALAAHLSPAGYYHDVLDVTLNEANLLAYQHTISQGHSFSRYYLESRPCRLVDLRTGYPLPLAAQLRPGGWRQVQRMLTSQAQADSKAVGARAHWWRRGQLPLPPGGLEVYPSGWFATYEEPESEPNTYAYSQDLSWAELRPLLRPNSPLHRLLKGRRLP